MRACCAIFLVLSPQMASTPGGMPQLSMSQLLDEIWNSSLPRAMRSYLAAEAVRAAVGPPPEQARPHPPGLAEVRCRDVEMELETIIQLTGATNVQGAKAKLRAAGSEGRRLASQMGRLSSARNQWAHPKGNLADQVAQLLREVEAAPATSRSSCPSWRSPADSPAQKNETFTPHLEYPS